jgi:hypothetical protein
MRVVPKLVFHCFYGLSLKQFGLTCQKLEGSNFNPNQDGYDLENLFGFNIICDLILTVDNYQTQILVFNLNYGFTVDLAPYFALLFDAIACAKAKNEF